MTSLTKYGDVFDVAPVSMSPFSIDGTLSVQTIKRINANSLQQNYDIQLDERHNQGKYRMKRCLVTKACVFSYSIKLRHILFS